LENALNNRFEAIDNLEEVKQVEIYTRIRENIQKVKNNNRYT
jgi:hypothetical protein